MKSIIILIFSFFTCYMNAQNTLDDVLKTYNSNEVPYISVQELAMPKTNAIILDAREPSEYNVSHLKGAVLVGYDHFKLDYVQSLLPNKNGKIVVYCSLGIRSETIAYKLQKAGYTNIHNLYGGIFEWKNNAFPVYDSQEKETNNVHAFSQAWSKWLLKGEKIYD